ncbi:ribokinase [Rhodobacteraceae bacterium RKSG542]|uniref:ribokinase n=1 Tax=Pseudovibrio flavus TaxID=2529854 RepID=UPI0012BC6B46|nr:ribokinase [Pseudovibrio flavus]MTI17200.1 ribokinase [Pseudovibrio flavus]
MITVFGSINLDLVVIVSELPKAGETVIGPDHQHFAGGKGANQALAARRAGADVAMVGAIGSDAFGTLAIENLKATGVDLSALHQLAGTTGIAMIGVESSGENQIIVASGVNARVEANWLEPLLAKAGVLVTQMEVPADATRAAMQLAKERGVQIIFNTAPAKGAETAELAGLADFVIANETEAMDIAAAKGLPTDLTTFAEAMGKLGHTTVVTLGAKGAIAHDGKNAYAVSAPQIIPVDTTGAGDAFVGAFAAAIDAGRTLEDALKEASAAGGLACTKTGAQSSAPDAGEIAALALQIEVTKSAA